MDAFFQQSAIDGYKDYTTNVIAYARYQMGGEYYRAPIHRRERLPDGRVAVYFAITPNANETVTITEVQLFNTNNELWGSKQQNIVIRNVQEGVLYRFVFDIREKTAEDE